MGASWFSRLALHGSPVGSRLMWGTLRRINGARGFAKLAGTGASAET